MLSKAQTREFEKTLKERYRALRDEIREELLQSDDERFIDLAGQVHDREEESLADLLVDLDLAVLDLHIEEVRDIDAALLRIATGAYGVCVDCDENIAVARLRAYPTAKRCRPCQIVRERSHAGRAHPSL